MHPYYIGCDAPPVTNGAGTRLQCTFSNGAESLTELQVQDLYAVPIMDNEDYQVIGQFVTFMFLFSFGVKLIRKLMGV